MNKISAIRLAYHPYSILSTHASWQSNFEFSLRITSTHFMFRTLSISTWLTCSRGISLSWIELKILCFVSWINIRAILLKLLLSMNNWREELALSISPWRSLSATTKTVSSADCIVLKQREWEDIWVARTFIMSRELTRAEHHIWYQRKI